jgi:cell filamentation protein
MPRHSDHDPYLDPVASALRNRLGLTDQAALEQAEAACVATRSYELSLAPLEGAFDLAHLQAIHRYLFGDVYEWAGQLRTIDIAKGGSHFAHHSHIENAAAPLFSQLARENHLAGLAPADFSGRAAFYLGEWNALHPFREGRSSTSDQFTLHAKRHTPFRYLPSLVRWLSLAALCSSWLAKRHNFRPTGLDRNV